MKLGIAMFSTDETIRPDDLGRACEERGFESIWFPEHTHIPASRKTPYPAGGDLPREYSHTHDPFVSLMAAGAVTKKLKLGTGICLVVEHHPIDLAKQIASLDALTDGRFLFGIGCGWNVEEMANHGTDFKRRWKVQRERILAMKEIWTKEEASFDGEFVRFERIWQWPKPAQRPHPPIFLGTHTEWGLDRVVDYCDGWLPIGLALPDFPAMIGKLHEKARAKGRNPAEISISLFWAPPDESELKRLAELGVERGILAVPSLPRDQVLSALDGLTPLVAKVA